MNTKANIGKILLAVFMILMTGGQVTAIDSTFSLPPICVSKSYDTGALLYTNLYSTTTGQTGENLYFDSTGVNTGSQIRIEEATSTTDEITCSVEDPFIHNAAGSRIWFVTNGKDVGYSDLPVQDFGLGVFNPTTNTYGYHKVGALSQASTDAVPARFTFDQAGNVYINEPGTAGNVVKKIDVSIPFALQTFYTVTAADYDDATSHQIIDIAFDVDNNLEILIGSQGAGATNNISRVIVDGTSGAKLSDNHFLKVFATVGTMSTGALIPDSTNPTTNFSYAYAMGTLTEVVHFSGGSFSDIGGGALNPFVVTDMEYDNGILYLADSNGKLIRSLATNFQGFNGFNIVASNPDGITGVFQWVNGYGTVITTMTPGAALAYKHVISDTQTNFSNYDYFSGWSPSPISDPSSIQDLTNLNGLMSPATFSTNSNELAGTSIYGYLLSRSKTTGQWSSLRSPVKLVIGSASVGFDSITLDKSHYNLTGDTITATLTYSSGYPPYFYQWQLCTRADCADGSIFNLISLIGEPATSSMSTTGLKEGNYYAVMMRHLPFLSNTIVAPQRFDIRPPVIGVSWDKPQYNLLPKSQPTSCLDATPTFNPWSNISGYAGLQTGWFSCNTTSASADANNSIMRGSLYAKFNGTFYLNNSFGSVWNGTLSNGSGALIYSLTNSSVTQTWTLVGVNQSGETFYATVEVVPESQFGYSLSVSPDVAYNGDTLLLAFTKPIWVTDFVVLKDAGGTTVANFNPSQGASGSYFIDPSKQYTYGKWTAYWSVGSIGSVKTQGQHIFTFTVKNAGRPVVNGSIIAENSPEYTSSQITDLLSSKIFWALLFIVGIMLAVAVKERGGQ